MNSVALSVHSQDPILAEDRKVERFARSEPDHMLGVVGEVVSGFGMGKDRQAVRG